MLIIGSADYRAIINSSTSVNSNTSLSSNMDVKTQASIQSDTTENAAKGELLDLKSYDVIEEITVKGIKTIHEIRKLIVVDVKKAIIIKNVHKLQKQYLPTLFKLDALCEENYPNIKIVLVSKYLLPLRFSKLFVGRVEKTNVSPSSLLINSVKNKNVQIVSEEDFYAYGDLLYKSIIKHPKNINIWLQWHDVACAISNGLINYQQAGFLISNNQY